MRGTYMQEMSGKFTIPYRKKNVLVFYDRTGKSMDEMMKYNQPLSKYEFHPGSSDIFC